MCVRVLLLDELPQHGGLLGDLSSDLEQASCPAPARRCNQLEHWHSGSSESNGMNDF